MSIFQKITQEIEDSIRRNHLIKEVMMQRRDVGRFNEALNAPFEKIFQAQAKAANSEVSYAK